MHLNMDLFTLIFLFFMVFIIWVPLYEFRSTNFIIRCSLYWFRYEFLLVLIKYGLRSMDLVIWALLYEFCNVDFVIRASLSSLCGLRCVGFVI